MFLQAFTSKQMPFPTNFRKLLFALLVATAGALTAQAQEGEASQMSFSNLQVQANTLVERGQLVEAMPLLKELITRVEGATETGAEKIELDFPIFLVGTGYIQLYINTGDKSNLEQTLQWYNKLEKEFPRSPKIKDASLKKIDVFRTVGQHDQATELMINILSGAYDFRLTYSEKEKILKDLVQTFYATGKLKEGLPYFGQLLEEAREHEDRAMAAAASFEALFAEKRFDDAMRLVPYLAKESEARYRPRLNVALLKASDEVVALGRINDAAILLNLIKTTDIMIEYHEAQLAEAVAKKEQRVAFGNTGEAIDKLNQQISTLEANLTQLRKLPTLRSELLVRRARNYTQTGRRYEAFWMFNDLKVEYPDSEQVEFYFYATFSNARQIDKKKDILKIGREYRSRFPDGDYYSDVTAVFAAELRIAGLNEEFAKVAVDFLDTRPIDPISGNLLAQWGAYMFEQEAFPQVIAQCQRWLKLHSSPSFEDGLHYWKGLAQLQTFEFAEAISSFQQVLSKFPTSIYAEDAMLRKGSAQFYAQAFEESRDTLHAYLEKYPSGSGRDQAYFFLGEIEFLAEDFQLSLQHFQQADSITYQQDIHDSVAFRIGAIHETLGEYGKMAAHFNAYIDTYGETGRLTDAIFELGRAYEFNLEPTKMLQLYSENIRKYIGNASNSGVDTLIEGYAEKFETNKAMLERTVAFLDQLDNDQEFRTKIVTDRGFLFEHFYVNPTLEQSLYNKLRNHPAFTDALLEDLSPINEITAVYRKELAAFPTETPETLFRDLLAKHKTGKNFIAEARSLMGLYRLDVELAPSMRFDQDLIDQATPRVILYVADFERNKRKDFAVQAWQQILKRFPQDDATIVAYMRLADVAADDKDLKGALDYLEMILTQFSGSPQIPAVILRQGELLSEMGDGKGAREKYQYILRVPDWRGILHATALFQTGEAYMAENAYAEAHGFFERTFLGYAQFNELCAKAYLRDAEALVGMGERASAVTTLQEAVDTLGAVAPDEIMSSIKSKLRELK